MAWFDVLVLGVSSCVLGFFVVAMFGEFMGRISSMVGSALGVVRRGDRRRASQSRFQAELT